MLAAPGYRARASVVLNRLLLLHARPQDEGGVTKELFQLLTRDLFNPEFGMFTYK